MTEEIEEVDVLETEQSDYVLDKRMKKLESEATRLLKTSSELLKLLSKEKAKEEEAQPENSEPGKLAELNKAEQIQS
jgi:hypothetical protein